MSSAQVFPVFTCEELTTDTVMPFFLSHTELAATWEEVMRQRGTRVPPDQKPQMNTLDLRFLAQRMQSGGVVDWSIVKFVGTERAYEAVREAQQQAAAGAMKSLAAEEDPEAEPPPLIADVEA